MMPSTGPQRWAPAHAQQLAPAAAAGELGCTYDSAASLATSALLTDCRMLQGAASTPDSDAAQCHLVPVALAGK